MKYKIEATIPTTQYGNLRPTFEIEGDGDRELAVTELKKLWNRFGESPLKDKSNNGVEVTTFTGEVIFWNERTHTHKDKDGNILMSGSRYADEHSPKFDKDTILPKTAQAWEVPKDKLESIWNLNSEISLAFGTAIHKALELAHLHYERVGKKIQIVKKLDENYAMHKQPFIRDVVKNFIDTFGLDAEPEVLVSDVENGRAGTVDRLAILDEEKKVCRIGDYKTNADMDKKKLLKYQKQLSFYAHILQAHGWKVDGLDIFYFDDDGTWKVETFEVLDLE